MHCYLVSKLVIVQSWQGYADTSESGLWAECAKETPDVPLERSACLLITTNLRDLDSRWQEPQCTCGALIPTVGAEQIGIPIHTPQCYMELDE